MTAIYEQEPSGSIRLKSGRRAWGVDIPAYVYDLWVPLIGFTAVGFYGCLCRLERDDHKVKGLTLKDLATYGRVGIDKMNQLLGMLETCGFIEVNKPEGWKRLAHHTTEIMVLDAPSEVSQEIINIWGVDSDKWQYKPLTTWLVEQVDEPPKTQIGSPQIPNGSMIEDPNGSSKFDPYEPSISTSRPAARVDISALFSGESRPAPAPTPVADTFDHPLVQFFMEKTGLKTLTKAQVKLFNDDIRVKDEDGFKTIKDGLVALWNTKPGFAEFCKERITSALSWSQPMTEENLLKHLRNLDKVDGKAKGFYAWAQEHPELTRTREEIAGYENIGPGPEWNE